MLCMLDGQKLMILVPHIKEPGGSAILRILIGGALKFENYFEVLFGEFDKRECSNFEQIGHH